MIFDYAVKRTVALILLASLVSIPLISVIPTQVSGMDDLSSDIVVNGNGGFASVIRSGTGTFSDPYIISDYNVSSANIQIKNTTSYVVIRNITFNSGSWSDRWGIYLYNARNVVIENVTSVGKVHFLYSYLGQYITVRSCNVNDIPSGNYVMELRATSFITISDCDFMKSPTSGGSTIFVNNQGTGQKFIDCVLNGISLTDQLFHTTGYIHNCTFLNSAVYLQAGNTGGQISDNIFRSPGKTALQLVATYRLRITDNYFEADKGIYFTGCQFQWNANVLGYMENNTFENCTVGIDSQLQNQNQPSRWVLRNNYFGNCSSYAINWQRGRSNWIFRNIFYHNAGTDDVTAGYQVYQVNMFNYVNVWTDTSGGNFWANHRTPDADVNGIVDVAYTFNNAGTDTMPFTNPYFDTGRPSISLTNPRGDYSESSYIRVKWDARDEVSGVGKVYLSVDGKPWMDISNLTDKSVFLSKGSHSINLTVFDRAGLHKYNRNMIIINRTVDILSIETPIKNEYYDSDPLRIMWTVRSGFPVTNQSITIDDIIDHLDIHQRVFDAPLAEGYHEIMVSIIDDQNLTLEKEVGFHVDRTPPVVNVLSPQPGSVLSNPIVSFNFEATDNINLSGLQIMIDNGEWEDALTYSTSSRFMKSGSHNFTAEAVDMAGLTTRVSVPFTIGGLNGLNIISPYDGQYTSKSSLPFIWDYNGTFDWDEAVVRVGASSEFQPVNQLPDGLIYMPDDGEYEISLRLVDEFENYIESSIMVVKDGEAPSIVFLQPDIGRPSNDRALLIEWAGLDDWGIASYSIMIDDGAWIDNGESTTYQASLEEGSHSITVLGIDLAGNTGENRIEITMDYTPPVIGLVSPKNGSIIKDPLLSFVWQAEDDDIIEELVLNVDDNEDVDLLDRDRYTQTFSRDSYHTAVLRAVDRAGNVVEVTSTFLIDSTPPVILWGDGPGSVFPHKWAVITFIIVEEVGISEINLIVGKDNYSVPVSDNYINITLEDGSYDLSLSVVDLAGHSDTVRSESPMIIDTIAPNVTISMDDTVVLNGKGVVYWFADGTGSGIRRIEIVVDGEDPVVMETGNTFSTEVLKPGGHTILVRAFDEAGNSGEAYWTFEVEGSEIDDGGGGGGGSGWMIIIIAVVVIFLLGLLILGFLVLRKRGSGDKEQIIQEQQEAPQLSLAKIAQNLPPSASVEVSNLLPPREPDFEDRVDGTGYIRPTKAPEKGAPEVSRHRLRSDGRSIDHGKEDHGTVELGGSGKRDIGTPWESERREAMKKEAEGVFVGQQPVGDDDHMREGALQSGMPVEDDAEIPVWGDDSEQPDLPEEEPGMKPPDDASSDPLVPAWGDVEFDENMEELEELEELEEME